MSDSQTSAARIMFINSPTQGTNAGMCSQSAQDKQTTGHSPNKPTWQAGTSLPVGPS